MPTQAENSSKSILALQLCKITPDEHTEHPKQYANLYKDHCIAEIKPHCYMTLGGFDAVSFYKLCDTSSNDKWLENVLEDRQRIIQKLSGTITYHPVHLIGENHIPEKNKILFLTFVYGVRDDKEFEANVKACLDKKGAHSKSIHIYECINLSERVIFTYSNNIEEILKGISDIVNKGYARKVYTTVSFPLEQKVNEAKICGSFRKSLSDATASDEKNFFASIKGSAKNYSLWENVVHELLSRLGMISDAKHAVYYNYGEDDFVIELPMNGKLLLTMLDVFMSEAKTISAACWDIHTELQLEFDTTALKETDDKNYPASQEELVSILDGEHKKLVEFVKELDKKNDRELRSYSWYYSLLELFPTLRNMDHHPLLKGPAYVMYDSLHIFNTYLAAYRDEFKVAGSETTNSTIPDLRRNRIGKIFRRSEERSISLFIRCLSRLADQLVQNDDVIFHGLGQEPAIATTQPESLLEFYHGFLRELADYLIKIDQEFGYITLDESSNDSYEYGFLLSPELNQRARLSELFWLKMEDRNFVNGKKKYAWPIKQAYIIQLPAEDVFKPMCCFFPLAHECFHIFGDKLRFRNNRFYYMTMFVSATLLAEWGKDDKDHMDMFWEICKHLSRGAEVFWDQELYMRQARSLLEENLDRLLSDWGMEDLYYELGKKKGDYLYTVTAKRKTEKTRLCYVSRDVLQVSKTDGSNHVDDCAYYFNECYADVMAITTFGMSSDDYLSMFHHELRYFDKKDGDYSPISIARIVGICQRIAVVLAALPQNEKDDSRLENLHTISTRYSTCLFGNCTIESLIKTCYTSLTQNDAEPLQPNNEGYKLYGIEPVSALSYVVDYLREVVKFYQENEKIKEIRNPYKVEETMGEHLKKVFDEVIRKENFFESDFKKVVSENRRRIDEKVKQ